MTNKRYTLADHEEYRRSEEEKARKADLDRRERQVKDAARQRWLADGGSESAFERSWREIRDEMRRRRIVDTDEQARGAHRASGVSTL